MPSASAKTESVTDAFRQLLARRQRQVVSIRRNDVRFMQANIRKLEDVFLKVEEVFLKQQSGRYCHFVVLKKLLQLLRIRLQVSVYLPA